MIGTMRLPWVLVLSMGCGPVVSVESADSGSSEGTSESEGPVTMSTSTTTGPPSTSTTTSPPSTSTTTTDPTVTTSDPDGSSGVTFVTPSDGGPSEQCMCDVFAQDCGQGDKCMPWSNDGTPTWNCTRCSPIADNPGQPGDVCMVEGSPVSGIDDCDYGAMCWNVDLETLEGTCVAQCTGNQDNPSCSGNTDCLIANDGVLNLCLPVCDPLADDCPPEQTCIESTNAFVCVPTGVE